MDLRRVRLCWWGCCYGMNDLNDNLRAGTRGRLLKYSAVLRVFFCSKGDEVLEELWCTQSLKVDWLNVGFIKDVFNKFLVYFLHWILNITEFHGYRFMTKNRPWHSIVNLNIKSQMYSFELIQGRFNVGWRRVRVRAMISGIAKSWVSMSAALRGKNGIIMTWRSLSIENVLMNLTRFSWSNAWLISTSRINSSLCPL